MVDAGSYCGQFGYLQSGFVNDEGSSLFAEQYTGKLQPITLPFAQVSNCSGTEIDTRYVYGALTGAHAFHVDIDPTRDLADAFVDSTGIKQWGAPYIDWLGLEGQFFSETLTDDDQNYGGYCQHWNGNTGVCMSSGGTDMQQPFWSLYECSSNIGGSSFCNTNPRLSMQKNYSWMDYQQTSTNPPGFYVWDANSPA